MVSKLMLECSVHRKQLHRWRRRVENQVYKMQALCVYKFISLFFTKNYWGFVCVNCVKIPAEFKRSSTTTRKEYIRHPKTRSNALSWCKKENESKLINSIKKNNAKHEIESREKDFVELIEERNSLIF